LPAGWRWQGGDAVEKIYIKKNLRSLSLASNSLTGAFPDVSALPKLKMLYLSGNRLAGQIPDDAFAASLKKLHLSDNAFTGPVPSSITSPGLLELRLSKNGHRNKSKFGTCFEIKRGLLCM
jgi:Leucine-rich repeat (LRR) protein